VVRLLIAETTPLLASTQEIFDHEQNQTDISEVISISQVEETNALAHLTTPKVPPIVPSEKIPRISETEHPLKSAKWLQTQEVTPIVKVTNVRLNRTASGSFGVSSKPLKISEFMCLITMGLLTLVV